MTYTITQQRVAPAKLSIGAGDLLDLLSGAIIATGRDDSILWRGGIMPMRYSA